MTFKPEYASDIESARSHARSTGLLFVAQIVAAAGAFITTVIIARTLGPSGRGIYAFAITVASLVAIGGQMGFGAAVSFSAAGSPPLRRQARRAYLFHAGIGTALIGAGVSVSMAAGVDLLPSASSKSAALLIGPTALAITIFDGAYNFRNAEQRFGLSAAMLMAGGVLPALVTVVLAVGGVLSPGAALAAWGSARLLIGAAGWLRPRIEGTSVRDPKLPAALRSYGRRAFAASVSGIVTLRADQWILGLIAGPSALGIYAVAVSVSDPALYIPYAFQNVLFPRIAAEPKRAVDLTSRTVRTVIVLVGLFVLVAAPLGLLLLPLVFGHAFAGSRLPFAILLPSAFGIAVLILVASATSASGRPGLASIVEIATGGTMIGLDLVLIPPLDATGAAIACTVAYTFGGVLSVLVFKRLHRAPTMKILPTGADLASIVRVVRDRVGSRSSAQAQQAETTP